MAHYINDQLIIFDRFNELLGVLIEMELLPPMKSLVTKAYVVRAIFYDENYSFAEIISSGRDGITKKARKQRNKKRDKSHVVKARDQYLFGITNRLILEHALEGGNGTPRDSSSPKGQRFTNMYGVPWPPFQEMSDEFEQWCLNNNNEFYCKATSPFKLRFMACFRQLRTGGFISQFRESHSIVGSLLRNFFYLFLDWHWDKTNLHIKIPTTREEIDHVENIYHLIGYPDCLCIIDCVHLPWGACTWTLQTQCKNKHKKKPTVVFEVISSHTKKVLHVSDMFWGACGESLIVKYDKAVHEVMDGRYSVLPFEVKDKDVDIIVIYGFYYICDGGYPKFKCLLCPFKCHQAGSDVVYWSESLEATRKDIEHCFGAMKKRSTIFVSPNTLNDALRIEQVFIACCVLHNILLDYSGGENLCQRMVPVPQKGNVENVEPTAIPNDFYFLRSKYRDDPEFQALLQQEMENPSHKLRAMARNYENSQSSSVDMVARLNKLQHHYLRTVDEGKLMKLKKMKDMACIAL
jgi:hypothetical protein